MTERKKDWVKHVQLAVSLVIALIGLGASWGASKAETAGVKAQVVSVQAELKETKEQVSDLATGGAVTQNELQNISDRLAEIQEQLRELDKKIERLRR